MLKMEEYLVSCFLQICVTQYRFGAWQYFSNYYNNNEKKLYRANKSILKIMKLKFEKNIEII